MAKLKILDNDDNTKPNESGYVNVVDNFLLTPANYEDFLDADPEERPMMLQGYAGVDAQGRACVVTHEPKHSAPEPINNMNCLIEVHIDRRKVAARSKHNMSVPAGAPPNVNYLQDYAKIIHDLYATGTPAGRQRACKFLFGIMLLTRCR